MTTLNEVTPEQWDRVGKHNDPVNQPSHYTHSEIECIDAMDSMLGREGSLFFYEGSIFKYLWRWRYKGGVQSLKKARWFLDRLIEREESKGG